MLGQKTSDKKASSLFIISSFQVSFDKYTNNLAPKH